MPRENYRRIRHGYEPHEPTTIGEQLFYIMWCFLCGLEILGIRIINPFRKSVNGKKP
ncbi:MAG: hypothetical protein WA977_12865 [Halobacteriota archaeon]